MTIYRSVSRFLIANLTITVVRGEFVAQSEYPETYDELWDALDLADPESLLTLPRVVSVEAVNAASGNGVTFTNAP